MNANKQKSLDDSSYMMHEATHLVKTPNLS